MAALKYWLWLTGRKGLGALGAVRLLNHFGSPEHVYYADPAEYALVEGLTAFAKEQLRDKNTDRCEKILADCDRLGLRLMTLQDADYPQRLRQISDPPAVLYIKGKLPAVDDEVVIGMVGAREPSVYGEKMASELGYELARGGAVVASGIARGLDSLALRGAMRAGGKVISVLGGGTDVYYPAQNRWLYEDVASCGALVSEYPPGTENKGTHFPIRNRIISGLSVGVVAVECKMYSGTMSTMNRALDQDRDLFAVPGPADSSKSEGTNFLIQQGAKLVTCAGDILVEYRERFPGKLTGALPVGQHIERRLEQLEPPQEAPAEEKPAPARPKDPREVIPKASQRERFTDDELVILRALEEKSCSADELVELTQIPVRRVTTALTTLHLKAAVDEQSGRRYAACVLLEHSDG